VALLATSTLGVMSSTVMSAPINDIAAGIDASAQEIVLAVSAFTIAMVIFAPLAGWLSERLGMTRFLLASILLMVVGQAGAALAPDLGVLVAMRAVQGIACSGIPPAIQQGLADFWPETRARSMAAWASAIGLGQAIGPPLGGLVTELVGWRWLFGIYAVVCLVVLVVVARTVPSVAPRRPDLDVAGMSQLVGAAGLLVTGLTWAGQGGDLLGCLALIGAGLALLAWSLRPRRDGSHLLGAGILQDRSYAVATLASSAGMASMGITMVGVPLFLGREVGLATGVIGATVFTVAFGMTFFGPVASRAADRIGAERTLVGGLVGVALVGVAVTWLEVSTHAQWVVGPLATLLLLIGCGLATIQSMSALVMLGDGSRRPGIALGVHNMGRFGGLALGYAWVAGVYAVGMPWLAQVGVTVLAGGAALLVLVGGRRAAQA
jgi:MFS family permease